LVLLFSGCDKEEQIPSYIYISEFVLDTENTNFGSNSHDFVDAWVYANNKLIGVFELPATIPILESGSKQLTIITGIRKNGLFYEREAYPFLKPYDIQHNFIPAQVDTIQPVVVYRENIKMPWIEDFEDNTLSFQGSGNSTNYDTMEITGNASEVFEYNGTTNKYSGRVAIPNGLRIFENSSVESTSLPRSGQEIYLEMNFKCNTEFVTGIYPLTGSLVTSVPIVNFYSTVDADGIMQWKKAYISLKEDVNNPEYAGAEFKAFIRAQTNTTSGTPLIYIDNVKLVHY